MTHVHRASARYLGLLAFALIASVLPAGAQVKGLQVGDRAPTVVIQTLDGKAADLAEYVGRKPVLIEFWATWCPLCRQMEPTITRIINENKDKLEVIRIVVPQNQTPEKAAAFVAKNELPGLFLFDAEGAAYKAFAAYHTSYIVVLDKQGKVMYSSDGGKQDLDAVVAAAMAKPSR
ncbi:MAG: redoxin family protein [Longimicrobiales bacterium]